MTHRELASGCARCGVTRRQFLSGCAACAGAAGFLTVPKWLQAAQENAKSRIRIVYALHGETQAGPDWPNKGFEFGPVMQRINSELAARCPECEFIPSLATGPEQAKKILEQDQASPVDGYLVYQMNAWNQVVQTLATAGKPVLYADFQFGGSGGFLVYTAAFLRKQTGNVGFVASSHLPDLVAAVQCFGLMKQGVPVTRFAEAVGIARRSRTPSAGNLSCLPDRVTTLGVGEWVAWLKQCKVLAVRGQESGPAGDIMGIPIVHVPFAELNDAWKVADKDQAREVAHRWKKGALEVNDVTQETLENCAAMYLAQKAVLKKYGANAITVNCLGGFYGGHIHAYPCLGFHELLNEGMVGGCECDVRSAATMVAMTAMTHGRPGYISDPVIDTAKRQIIYAHCVASNKPFGPRGKANPYEILTHSEDRQGASVRSLLPTGYMTTTVEVAQERKEILMHRAKTVGNDPDDRACRTKLCAEPVGDIEKLFTQWDQWGWHRVTYYGDLKDSVYAMADVLGWKVVEEA